MDAFLLQRSRDLAWGGRSVAVLGGGQGGHGPRPRALFDQKGPRKIEKNAKYSIENVKYGHIKGL